MMMLPSGARREPATVRPLGAGVGKGSRPCHLGWTDRSSQRSSTSSMVQGVFVWQTKRGPSPMDPRLSRPLKVHARVSADEQGRRMVELTGHDDELVDGAAGDHLLQEMPGGHWDSGIWMASMLCFSTPLDCRPVWDLESQRVFPPALLILGLCCRHS
jgi:hypothetical protein